ncbi:MAG: COQ9 family protein [Shimia sp.]
METTIDRLLDAALPHVVFDGWSQETFRNAARDAEISEAEARAACPRGALDLAVAYHKAGDAEMIARLEAADLADMRFRDRVAFAVRQRLELVEDKEAVRRGTTLFALPPYAAEGARLIWGTADAIWTALGDTSDDLNWYTKRATLGGVYSSTVLYWLGDDSLEHQATWDFLDRRIENVMQFEKVKAQAQKVPGVGRVMDTLNAAVSRARAPAAGGRSDLPGYWGPR